MDANCRARRWTLDRGNRPLAAVLHDLNLAMTYADDVWVLRAGELVAAGPVVATLAPALIGEVFGVEASFSTAPASPGRISW